MTDPWGWYIYMLTKRGYIDGIHVTIYSSTMDPMGNSDFLINCGLMVIFGNDLTLT